MPTLSMASPEEVPHGHDPESAALDEARGSEQLLARIFGSRREQRMLEFVQGLLVHFLPWTIMFLCIVGIIPFTTMVLALLCVFCCLTCIRTLALSAMIKRLQRGNPSSSLVLAALAQQVGPDELPLSLVRSNAINLVNLRLSMLDRDFTDADYELLLALDGAAGPGRQATPLTEQQISSIPIHIHKRGVGGGKGGKGRSMDRRTDTTLSPRRGFGAQLLAKLGMQQPAAAAVAAGGPQGPAAQGPGAAEPPSSPALPRSESQLESAARSLKSVLGGGDGMTGGMKRCPSEDHMLCSVCLDPFAEGARVMTLPTCGHQFHEKCMRAWLKTRGAATPCPVCKASVF